LFFGQIKIHRLSFKGDKVLTSSGPSRFSAYSEKRLVFHPKKIKQFFVADRYLLFDGNQTLNSLLGGKAPRAGMNPLGKKKGFRFNGIELYDDRGHGFLLQFFCYNLRSKSRRFIQSAPFLRWRLQAVREGCPLCDLRELIQSPAVDYSWLPRSSPLVRWRQESPGKWPINRPRVLAG
jgi:hypothetical protein